MVMLERDSGRPRGFGFVTFADRRAMEDAIVEMNNQDLNGRTITVNEAQPKPADDPRSFDYTAGGRGGRNYSSGLRGPGAGGGYHDRDRGRGPPPVGNSDCFKCGRPGHWARECPSGDGGGGGRFPSRPRFGGAPGGRGDRFGGGDRFSGGGRYVDDRYDGGRYGDRDRDRFDGRSNGRDRYSSDRYGGDHYGVGDRYGVGLDRYPTNGFGKERGSYDRDIPPRGVGDRYVGGGPTRYEGGGGGYRERPGPYDRPARVGRPSSYDR